MNDTLLPVEEFADVLQAQTAQDRYNYDGAPNILLLATFAQTTEWIAKLFSIASIAGSSIIIHSIIGSRQHRNEKFHSKKTIFYRLLLGLSICDIISSIGFFLGTWMVPQTPPIGWEEQQFDLYFHYDTKYPWSYGNKVTCQFQGFLLQIGMTGSGIFSACIAIQYVLVVRYQWKERTMKYAQYVFFGIATLFPFITATYSLVHRYFNVVSTGFCYINQYPIICSEHYFNLNETIHDWCFGVVDDSSSTNNSTLSPPSLLRDDGDLYISEVDADFYRNIFGHYVFFIALIIIVISMILLYLTVRQQEQAASPWSTAAQEGRDQRRVIRKAIWLIGMFLVVYVPPTISGLFFYDKTSQMKLDSYGLDFLANVCLSSQGILNAIVLSRQTIVDWLSKHCPGLKSRCCSCFGDGGYCRWNPIRCCTARRRYDDDDDEGNVTATPTATTTTATTRTKTLLLSVPQGSPPDCIQKIPVEKEGNGSMTHVTTTCCSITE